MPEMTLDWVVGFIEGEGTFSGAMHTKTHWQPNFSVYQDDRDVLERVQEFFADLDIIGGVYKSGARNNWKYSIQRKDECRKLYALIRPRMQIGIKIAQIDIWTERLGIDVYQAQP